MSERIRQMYRSAGISPPDGKGIHTEAAHECVINYRKKGMSKDEAWQRCMGGLGRNKAVKKSHWGTRKTAKAMVRKHRNR